MRLTIETELFHLAAHFLIALICFLPKFELIRLICLIFDGIEPILRDFHCRFLLCCSAFEDHEKVFDALIESMRCTSTSQLFLVLCVCAWWCKGCKRIKKDSASNCIFFSSFIFQSEVSLSVYPCSFLFLFYGTFDFLFPPLPFWFTFFQRGKFFSVSFYIVK